MRLTPGITGVIIAMTAGAASLNAASPGELDPPSVVEQWSDDSQATKIIDINFSDTRWPSTWTAETGRDCPDFSSGGYVNAVLEVPANGGAGDVTYPVLFHNCMFANKTSYGGYGGATAAFSRQYYLGEKATNYNDWKQAGHKNYLEDNIRYDSSTGKPIYGEAGFVQMCRDAAAEIDGTLTSLHGWMEIDHIPYVERVQWSWSSTSWGRGIKCDIKIGDGDWEPLVWMGSERQKQGWTVYSDQGYFMENVIDASDVSLRWRVWDGEDLDNPVQGDGNGGTAFTQAIDPMAQRQAPRVHKVRIFGNEISASDAELARNNPIGDVGKLSNLDDFETGGKDNAPDADAPLMLLSVNPDGSADHTTIQAAIDAIPDGYRGIIYIAPGVYEENVYAGTKESHNKFISLIGSDPATTILTSSVSRGAGASGVTFNDCAALNVYVPRFYAENLTIRNTSGNVGQAEALYTAGDAHMFKNCVLSGYQDTYKANVGSRGYFVDCVVEGAVDFIYDGGLEWFENCEIRCVKGGGYITAPSSSGMPMTRVLFPELSAESFYPGLFFNNCRVTAADGVTAGSYVLGRPWDENCGSMFLNCVLGDHISAAGWRAWNGNENSASFYEYNSINSDGEPADLSGRVSFARQASDAEVEAYMNAKFMFERFSDVPFDFNYILNSATAPTNFTVNRKGFTWESDELAAGYLIYLDGELVAMTETPSYTTTASGNYTVSTISRYGVTSRAVEAREATRVPAFPTAEGFGKYATGGRGGKIVKVTSLADDGSEGTLRWAFNQYKNEPITIVFEVSGDIALSSELRVNRADWTLAGQTAPGEGIVITRNKVNFGGSQNFIVRNVRFRIGQKNLAGTILADNACGAENCSNFIFDHCSFGWSVEENMNTADCHFLTVQYCMVHEGLYNAGHSKGVRGYGCQWGGSPATYHHNLLAHNQSRSCRFNGARGEDYVVFMEYANNVNYNYGKAGNCYGGENTADISSYNGKNSAHECNFMNNYYRPGNASNQSQVVFVNSSYARDGAKSWGPAKWYVNGNVAHGIASATADNWTAMQAEGYKLADIRVDERIVPENAYYKYSIAGAVGKYVPSHYMLENIQTADDAYATVVAKAGCVNRDKVEKRVADDARTGTTTFGGKAMGASSGIIDTENDAEGFFAYSTDYTVPTDSDGDGMPDEWEIANGYNPDVADNNELTENGYTAIEVYLAYLMGEDINKTPAGIDKVITSIGEMKYDATTSTLLIPEEAIGATVTIYSTDGKIVSTATVNETAMSLLDCQEGMLLIYLHGDSITPRVLKIIR
ncbi:MAG: hypothetical protein K2G49_04570 [Muribaculum sp.]|nr:hypothetical protein [Muribaculum sp.]